MSFTHLDRYSRRRSWLTDRTTPYQRLLMALVAAFAAGLMPTGARWSPLILALIVAGGVLAARVPLRPLLLRLIRLAPFFLLPALALPFAVPGRTVLEVGPLAASEEGWVRAGEIIVRAGLAVTAVSTVIFVTRAADLLAAVDRLPLPRVIRESLAMGYRYVYLLNDELERTQRALDSRAGDAPLRRQARARAAALVHLLVRAHDRTSRIHAAMLSRGYEDRLRTLQPSGGSGAWMAAIIAALIATWLLGLVEAA